MAKNAGEFKWEPKLCNRPYAWLSPLADYVLAPADGARMDRRGRARVRRPGGRPRSRGCARAKQENGGIKLRGALDARRFFVSRAILFFKTRCSLNPPQVLGTATTFLF